jgi:hypothetical protein
MLISWLELAPPELNNGSCAYGERGDMEGCEDDLGEMMMVATAGDL